MDFFIKRKLQKCNPDKINFFSLENQIVHTIISNVYDGDSCTLILPIYSHLHKINCRLNRIDTAELRTKDPDEKQHAIEARNRLCNFKNQILTVSISKTDKYGRYLVDLYTKDGVCINDLLVREGLAYTYEGKTKKPFKTWINQVHGTYQPRKIIAPRSSGLFSCFRCLK